MFRKRENPFASNGFEVASMAASWVYVVAHVINAVDKVRTCVRRCVETASCATKTSFVQMLVTAPT